VPPLRVPKRADRARVTIQSVSGRTVKVLGPVKTTLPYRRVTFVWRAVDRARDPLNPGAYFVRLELLDSGRDVVFDDRAIVVRRSAGPAPTSRGGAPSAPRPTPPPEGFAGGRPQHEPWAGWTGHLPEEPA
jgi:hypothetical protein